MKLRSYSQRTGFFHKPEVDPRGGKLVHRIDQRLLDGYATKQLVRVQTLCGVMLTPTVFDQRELRKMEHCAVCFPPRTPFAIAA